MSERSQNTSEMKRIFIKGMPFYLTKDNRALKLTNALQDSSSTAFSGLAAENYTKKAIKLLPAYQEDIIFESVNPNDEYLKGEFLRIVLRNRLHRLTNSSSTIASYVRFDNTKVEKTSANVANLIGQKNYDAVFVALCSVISQELKVRAMLALLTAEKSTADVSCQTDFTNNTPCVTDNKSKVFVESSCQTDEVCPDLFSKKKPRIRRRVTPFVVKEDPKKAKVALRVNKIVINPNNKEDCEKYNLKPALVETKPLLEDKKPVLPDLKVPFDEDSNSSILSNISMSNISICSDILKDQEMKLLRVTNHNTEKFELETVKLEEPESVQTEPLFVENLFIVTFDGTKIAVPVKPEDQFHLATPEILKHITSEERRKLLLHQAFIDWKLCLETDEDGNMPIHLAALHQDEELIRRQGLMLKSKGTTVDERNGRGLTALMLSIQHSSSPVCCRALLDLGADPLLCDTSLQTSLHLAPSRHPDLMSAVLSALSGRAREIITDHEEMLYPGLLDKSDAEIARHLLLQASIMHDSQGYTPLMLACKLGNYENVKLLVERSPETVNTSMPNSGNTALAIAVTEACLHAVESSNRSKVPENFLKTVEILLENGADPEIENLSGTKVSDLLQELNINSLSTLIVNKVTSRFFENPLPSGSKNFDAFMLIKDDAGNIKIIKNGKEEVKLPKTVENPIKTPSDTKKSEKPQIVNKKPADKPVILENVAINTKKSGAPIKKIFLPKLAPKSQDHDTLYKSTLKGAQTVNINKKQLPESEPSTIVDVPANIIIKNQGNLGKPVNGPVIFTFPSSNAPNTSTEPIIINPKGTATLIKVTLSTPTTSTAGTVTTLPNLSNVPVTVIETLNDLNKTPGDIPPKNASQPVNSIVKVVTANENPNKSSNAIPKNVIVTEMSKSDNTAPKRKATGPLNPTANEVNKKQKSCD